MIAMQNLSRIFLMIFLLLGSHLMFGQKDTTNQLDTQKLIIIKPYSPTISDAVKKRQHPAKDTDSKVLQKKEVTYDIYSVPVASTFTPEKGRASGLRRPRGPKLYDNYAALGIGNYTNIFAEIYSNIEISKQQNLNLELEHQSSQGGIDKVQLDDKYADTRFDMQYTSEENQFFWSANAGVTHQHYNWYGIFDPNNLMGSISDINPRHNYVGVSLGGDLKMKSGAFDNVTLNFRHFGDDNKGSENHVVIRPKFQFPVQEEMYIDAEVFGDYLSGKFGRGVINPSKYSWFNFGFHPSINLTGEDYALNIGGQLAYSADVENDDGEVYIYPKIKGSYRVAGDLMTIYAGVEGGLTQNSYYGLVQGNPYVAPDLTIKPTHSQYDVYAGMKGRLSEALNYDLRAGFKDEENKPLYATNTVNDYSDFLGIVLPGYTHANTFKVLYDRVRTLSLHGALAYEVYENFNLGLSATFYNYNLSEEAKAWNLPELEASLNADYLFAKKWSIGGDLLFVGERRDMISIPESLNQFSKVRVKEYVDANLRLDYQITDRFGVFARGNNLFNNSYDRWYHYPVQGIQGMLGLSYQF